MLVADVRVPRSRDYLASKVMSLLRMNGANTSTQNCVDECGIVWRFAGNAAFSTAQSQWGGSSLLLDGNGDLHLEYALSGDVADRIGRIGPSGVLTGYYSESQVPAPACQSHISYLMTGP